LRERRGEGVHPSSRKQKVKFLRIKSKKRTQAKGEINQVILNIFK
jgi:hypothetical protein